MNTSIAISILSKMSPLSSFEVLIFFKLWISWIIGLERLCTISIYSASFVSESEPTKIIPIWSFLALNNKFCLVYSPLLYQMNCKEN